MEATYNFRHALEFALNRRKLKNIASNQEPENLDLLVEDMIRNQFVWVQGHVIDKVGLLHRRVRRLYIRKTWDVRAIFTKLDWHTLVDWLLENWDEILKIVLAILPLLI